MSIAQATSQNKSPVYSNSPMSNYRDNGYRLPVPYRLPLPRKTITVHEIEPVYSISKEMINDFTSHQQEEIEVEAVQEEAEEVEEIEEFDEAFLSEIEKSHRKMGKE